MLKKPKVVLFHTPPYISDVCHGATASKLLFLSPHVNVYVVYVGRQQETVVYTISSNNSLENIIKNLRRVLSINNALS